jgi:hypothetical protein
MDAESETKNEVQGYPTWVDLQKDCVLCKAIDYAGPRVRLIRYLGPANQAEWTVPEEVQEVSFGAFFNLPELTKITFHASIEKVQEGAIVDLPNLKEFVLPAPTEGNEDKREVKYESPVLWDPKRLIVLAIANKAVAQDGTVTLPLEVKSIGTGALGGATDIVTLVIPKGLNTVEEGALARCSSIKEFKYRTEEQDEGLIKIKDGNKYLSSVKTVEGRTAETVHAVAAAAADGTVTIANPTGEIPLDIDEYAFSGFKGTYVALPSKLSDIKANAFEDSKVKNLDLRAATLDTVQLRHSAFDKAEEFRTIIVPAGATPTEEASICTTANDADFVFLVPSTEGTSPEVCKRPTYEGTVRGDVVEAPEAPDMDFGSGTCKATVVSPSDAALTLKGKSTIGCKTQLIDNTKVQGFTLAPGAKLTAHKALTIQTLTLEFENQGQGWQETGAPIVINTGATLTVEKVEGKLSGLLAKLPSAQWKDVPVDTTLVEGPGFTMDKCNEIVGNFAIKPDQETSIEFKAVCQDLSAGKLLAESPAKMVVSGTAPEPAPKPGPTEDGDDGDGNKEKDGLGGGAVAGIVIAVAVVVALVVGVATYLLVKKKNRVNQDNHASA